jgi:hypothetical protein
MMTQPFTVGNKLRVSAELWSSFPLSKTTEGCSLTVSPARVRQTDP